VPKTILFDIDYTLIDTDKLRQLTHQQILKQLKISKAELARATENFSKTLKSSLEFSPQRYSRFLANYFADSLIGKRVIDIFNEPAIYQQATYPETTPTLKILKQDYPLGIFSEGVRKSQIAKIALSGIINYLDRDLIFIYPKKKGVMKSIIRKIGRVYVIDNNLEHIIELSKINGVSPIWLKRGPKVKIEVKLNCPTIFSLEEIRSHL
jgi:FMN phosphatase YigB (HAD superfamily)